MNVPIRPEDLDALEVTTKELASAARHLQAALDRERPLDAPAAFLFFAGNAMYFDEAGEQIVRLQKEGWCGLHEFVARYPDAPVAFHPWRQPPPYTVERELLPGVLACLRTPGKGSRGAPRRKAKVRR